MAGAVAGAVLAFLFARGFPELAGAFRALSFLPLAVALFFLFVGLVQVVFGERANVLTQPGEQQLSLASCFFVLAFMTFVFVLVGTVAVMMPR